MLVVIKNAPFSCNEEQISKGKYAKWNNMYVKSSSRRVAKLHIQITESSAKSHLRWNHVISRIPNSNSGHSKASFRNICQHYSFHLGFYCWLDIFHFLITFLINHNVPAQEQTKLKKRSSKRNETIQNHKLALYAISHILYGIAKQDPLTRWCRQL